MLNYPVRKVCRTLNITISAYYHKKKYIKKPRYTEEEKQAVKEVYLKHFGNFGRRIIRVEMMRQGITMSEKKISRIMKEMGLRSKYGRKKCKNVYTSKEASERYIKENLYPSLENKEEREIWSMDFTEEKISGKTVYTCGIISVNSKILKARITGKRNSAETAIETLKEGIRRYGAPYMVMTDRGSPFVSKEFQETLGDYGIVQSMSRPHTPIDNVYIETFWESMKVEIGEVKGLTMQEYMIILEFYEYYYNHERPHGSLGYRAPLQDTSPTVI